MTGQQACDGAAPVGEELPVCSATIGQVLTGHRVGLETDVTRCTVCADVLIAGDIVFAYGARCVEVRDWVVPRIYCVGCAPATVQSPTLGVAEAIVGGHLGTQSAPTARAHHHCLVELACRARSPPSKG